MNEEELVEFKNQMLIMCNAFGMLDAMTLRATAQYTYTWIHPERSDDANSKWVALRVACEELADKVDFIRRQMPGQGFTRLGG